MIKPVRRDGYNVVISFTFSLFDYNLHSRCLCSVLIPPAGEGQPRVYIKY